MNRTYYKVNRNSATELFATDHVTSKQIWKGTFNFTETAKNDGLERGTVSQIMRFISHFSLKLRKVFENIFKITITMKNRELVFWSGCLCAVKSPSYKLDFNKIKKNKKF